MFQGGLGSSSWLKDSINKTRTFVNTLDGQETVLNACFVLTRKFSKVVFSDLDGQEII